MKLPPSIAERTGVSVSHLMEMSNYARRKFLSSLTDTEAAIILYDWRFWAREEQLAPAGDWLYWLYMGGRGTGKTRAGSEWIRSLAEQNYCEYMALVGADAADVRDFMITGPSGILTISPPWFKPEYKKQDKTLVWPNGVKALCYSAIDPESLRGPNIGAAWCDELAKWRYLDEAWDMLSFTMREGRRPKRLITTTPRPVKKLKEILEYKNIAVSRGSTYDNLLNLSSEFLKDIKDKYEGSRLGRQELYAELLTDNPYALWNLSTIDNSRVLKDTEYGRTVVAVDPPVTSNRHSDECGIIIASKGFDEHCYIRGDVSCQGLKPAGWANKVIGAYYGYLADCIVVEVNQGGDLVYEVIKRIDPEVPVIMTRAYKGKWLRAEPVASKYEQKRVHHVGIFPELEDQMCNFEPEQIQKNSPDRVDALVYAVNELTGNANANLRGL